MNILPGREKSSTQQFTEIVDIKDNVVLLQGERACLIIQVSSVNFALLSADEQNAKVYAYATLLNSLSFPIEIIIRSKPVEIKPYLDRLDGALAQTHNTKLADSITKYKMFIENLVKLTTVLDKQFYFVISYSSLETGVKNFSHSGGKNDFFLEAKAALITKAESLISQIDRLYLNPTILEKDALITFFHDVYNPNTAFQSQDGASK
ncbi:MAG TPA: hypothetical protein VGT05_03035 [Patescibacteria group bacterium]|nr:hypothetical protein [Patescibacteria group bacterium]